MSDKGDRRRESQASSVFDRLTYLLMGGGIGAILALLFAPKSGSELRGDIADAARKGIDSSRQTASAMRNRASEYYDEVRDKAGELVGDAREAARRKSGQLSAAIEAGKQAYSEERLRERRSGARGDLGGNETKEDYPSGNPSGRG